MPDRITPRERQRLAAALELAIRHTIPCTPWPAWRGIALALGATEGEVRQLASAYDRAIGRVTEAGR